MNTQVEPIQLGAGLYWQDLTPGQAFRTLRRTVTETDLVGFINVTGMVEEIFIDATFNNGAIAGRPVPGALTYALIEGLILQTMIQRTGLALLEMSQRIHRPVRVNDSIHALITIDSVRPTSSRNRAVVASTVEVCNHQNEQVMTYTAVRLLAGRK